MNLAARTFPVHDAECAHRWQWPTIYVPSWDPRTGERRLPLAMIGPGRCAVCGTSKLSVMLRRYERDPVAQIRDALAYLRNRYGFRWDYAKPAPAGRSDHWRASPR